MAIDSTKFGLTKDIEVKFFTPEEAASIPGASSGYNAVHVIKEGRVRYELLQAGKVSPEPVKVAAIKQVVEQQKPQKAPKQKAVEPEVKPVEVKVVEETTPEVAEPQE